MGSETEGNRFVHHKKGMWYKTSSIVVTKTNLISSDSLTHAESGMASKGSESASSNTNYPAYFSVDDSKGAQSGTTSK